jgi:hypothetical protein
MDYTPNLGIAHVEPAQAQIEILLNESWTRSARRLQVSATAGGTIAPIAQIWF